MGGLCSVCSSGQEQAKAGAWEDLSGGWIDRESVITGIPMTINVPDVKRGADQSTRRRVVVRNRYTCPSDDEDDDEDEDDDSIAALSKLNVGSQPDPLNVSNASADLLLSDSDCDDSDHSQEEEDEDEDDLDDDDDDDDDDANLLGENLFPTEREESDAEEEDEVYIQNSQKDQTLTILSTLLSHETDAMLQYYPDKESRLIKPSFMEQYNCLGTV